MNGARKFEEWLINDYPKVLAKIREEGIAAKQDGKSIEDNPHRVKIYRETWEQGWKDG